MPSCHSNVKRMTTFEYFKAPMVIEAPTDRLLRDATQESVNAGSAKTLGVWRQRSTFQSCYPTRWQVGSTVSLRSGSFACRGMSFENATFFLQTPA